MGIQYYGQLGLGDFTSRLTPQQLTFNFGVVISLISCGGNHSIALDNQGFVWIWGNNNKGQLGLFDTTNRNIPQKLNLKNISQIVCGFEYSMALDINGDIWSWGSND
jgi:Alpha-tubulin suppressor and related RCC1 domain-containing proteins